MKINKTLALIYLVILFGCKNSTSVQPEENKDIKSINRPTISFTFDDGSTSDIVNYKFEEWNNMILSHLESKNLKAIFFVTGKNKLDEKGQYLLRTWNENGHRIANHTFTHSNFSS
ncbi:polysaccharide deacetylase family protein [Winogradskyella sp. R77965]|uniref:polysaccharide deacetylase family protein n=1 Tax=Winogradskyella sp. R77965 TaxID=3093872 RepID=UPI0037DC7F50